MFVQIDVDNQKLNVQGSAYIYELGTILKQQHMEVADAFRILLAFVGMSLKAASNSANAVVGLVDQRPKRTP